MKENCPLLRLPNLYGGSVLPPTLTGFIFELEVGIMALPITVKGTPCETITPQGNRCGHYAAEHKGEDTVFENIAQVKAANKAIHEYWFEPETMRFFATKLESGLIGGCYFVTSESFPTGPRRATIRQANPDGSIETVGDFGGYRDVQAALRAAWKLAEVA